MNVFTIFGEAKKPTPISPGSSHAHENLMIRSSYPATMNPPLVDATEATQARQKTSPPRKSMSWVGGDHASPDSSGNDTESTTRTNHTASMSNRKNPFVSASPTTSPTKTKPKKSSKSRDPPSSRKNALRKSNSWGGGGDNKTSKTKRTRKKSSKEALDRALSPKKTRDPSAKNKHSVEEPKSWKSFGGLLQRSPKSPGGKPKVRKNSMKPHKESTISKPRKRSTSRRRKSKSVTAPERRKPKKKKDKPKKTKKEPIPAQGFALLDSDEEISTCERVGRSASPTDDRDFVDQPIMPPRRCSTGSFNDNYEEYEDDDIDLDFEAIWDNVSTASTSPESPGSITERSDTSALEALMTLPYVPIRERHNDDSSLPPPSNHDREWALGSEHPPVVEDNHHRRGRTCPRRSRSGSGSSKSGMDVFLERQQKRRTGSRRRRRGDDKL